MMATKPTNQIQFEVHTSVAGASAANVVILPPHDRDRRRREAEARWRFAAKLNAGAQGITPDWQEAIDNYRRMKAERVSLNNAE